MSSTRIFLSGPLARALRRPLSSPLSRTHLFHTSMPARQQGPNNSGVVDPATISRITHQESALTGSPDPLQGGPTAQAQKHAHEPLTPGVVADIAQGADKARAAAAAQGTTVDPATISRITHQESTLTGSPDPLKGGPTAQAQKHADEPLTPGVVADIAAGVDKARAQAAAAAPTPAAAVAPGSGSGTSGVVDAELLSRITHKESALTGSPDPVKGGPTAQAQKHADEPLTGRVVADVAAGEKVVTGGLGDDGPAPGPVRGGPAAEAQREVTQSRA